MSRLAILALCLCVAGAAADMTPECGEAGVPGGWSAINGDVDQDVLDTVYATFVENYLGNITAGWTPCDGDELTTSAAGCSQVVAGTKYALWVNLTCIVDGQNTTVGLETSVYQALPSDGGMIMVNDMDVEFLSVNGVLVDDHPLDRDDDNNDSWDGDSNDDDRDDRDDSPLDDDKWTDVQGGNNTDDGNNGMGGSDNVDDGNNGMGGSNNGDDSNNGVGDDGNVDDNDSNDDNDMDDQNDVNDNDNDMNDADNDMNDMDDVNDNDSDDGIDN